MSDELRLGGLTALNPVDSTNWSGRRQQPDQDRAKPRAQELLEEEDDALESDDDETSDEDEPTGPSDHIGGIIDVSA